MPATKALLLCETLLTCMIGFEWSSRRCRPCAGARLRNHLHRPDRRGAHVHRGPEIPTHIPSLGSTKLISLAFVDDVIQAPSRAVAFFSHPFTQQQSTEAEVPEDGCERGILEQFGVVAHEDVNVSRLVVLIGPDHRMIAHLGAGVGRIGGLVNPRQNVHIRARRFVVGVPLLLIHYERFAHIFHDRVRRIFYDDRRRQTSEYSR